jgi:thiamine biosynthesis lipoprotein
MRRVAGVIAIAVVTMASALSCAAPGHERWTFAEVHMGMPVRITLYAPTEEVSRVAARAAFSRIAQLDHTMSDYLVQGELRAVEVAAPEWVRVSDDLFEVLLRAAEIARDSEGAFDITAAPVIQLWRRARTDGKLPPRSELDSARALVGWDKVHLDHERRAVRLPHPGMRLDLGGIAKGYILQQALLAIREEGVTSALLEAGGDIVAGDAPPGRKGWEVALPFGSGAGQATLLAPADSIFLERASTLANAALATSGSSAQYVEIGGVKYSHVVDPRTGLGLTSSHTVHVWASDAATADAVATALMVLGDAGAKRLLERYPGVMAIFRY